MYHVTIDLYRDWVKTVKDALHGFGERVPEGLGDEEITLRYFRLGAADEADARMLNEAGRDRMLELQDKIMANLETVIIPDIRKRTGYEGNAFRFSWVYNQGEHIIEHCSEYRIPL